MRAVAERVGVSPPAIYMHFADKDELFYESCTRRFEEMRVVMLGAAEPQTDPVAKLRAMARAYIELALSQPEQYEVMMQGPIPLKDPDGDPATMPGAQALLTTANAIDEGIAAGVVRQDLDPLTTAVALWASVHGVVMIISAKRKQPIVLFDDEEAAIEQLLDIMSRGLVV
jgi:AcrR family transcriptional regulator